MEEFSQDYSVQFGARLKDERERMGRSQHAFGELGGVGKLAQLNYEKGVRVPSVDYLWRLGEHGVDVAYLLTGERAKSEDIDADLLTACIAAIDASFEAAGFIVSAANDRARFSALLYQVLSQSPYARSRVGDMATAMVSGWVLAMEKTSG